jgi:RNA polymerase sigma-70 factor (sigma-E family)
VSEGRYDGVHEFVAAHGDRMLRLAILLTGSRDAGEDLFQQGLERMIRRWNRIEGDPEAYLRTTLSRLAIDRWRLRARRPEVLAGELPTISVADSTPTIDLRDSLTRALSGLPARQRAVLVLRHWMQLSEHETAEALGCSVGTIKSANSRGLAKLRNSLDLEPVPGSTKGARP